MAEGEHIRVQGTVTGVVGGEAIPESILEIWQATSTGKYPHEKDIYTGGRLDEHVHHYIRIQADSAGRYEFSTIKPGGYPVPLAGGDSWWRAPHIHFRVSAPNYKTLVTQLYFADEKEANQNDKLQQLLTPPQRDILQREVEQGLLTFPIVLSVNGYPGVGPDVRPWDMGLQVRTDYVDATEHL